MIHTNYVPRRVPHCNAAADMFFLINYFYTEYYLLSEHFVTITHNLLCKSHTLAPLSRVASTEEGGRTDAGENAISVAPCEMEDAPQTQTDGGYINDIVYVDTILDIESVGEALGDRSMKSSPKMGSKALSRWSSCRAERSWCAINFEEEVNEPSKKVLTRANSLSEPLKQSSLLANKVVVPANSTLNGLNLGDSMDGRAKRLNRFMATNPRNVLFILATLSSMGTLILIYFTLRINGTV